MTTLPRQVNQASQWALSDTRDLVWTAPSIAGNMMWTVPEDQLWIIRRFVTSRWIYDGGSSGLYLDQFDIGSGLEVINSWLYWSAGEVGPAVYEPNNGIRLDPSTTWSAYASTSPPTGQSGSSIPSVRITIDVLRKTNPVTTY